ncbi:MAG: SH3 domain-containing protein [Cloacibacillus evryensis]
MRKFIMAATILLCLTGASFASENICGTTKEMMNAEFWVKGTKTAHETILAPAEVQALTAKIREAPGTFCTDILDYPDFLSREEFARKIKSYAARPDNKRYVGAAEADGEFWRRVESNANPGAADETTLVRFGAVVNNCLVKTLPCEEPLYSEADDVLFRHERRKRGQDMRPLAVLHESADDKYYFVESPYCAGWIKKENVALTDRKTLKELAAHDFYMVTGAG